MRQVRIKSKKPGRKVPPDAVELYMKLKALRAAGLDNIFERDGGSANQFNRLSYQLCDYFPGVDRWKATPVEAMPPEHLGWLTHPHNVGYWRAAYEAHVRLEEAATKMSVV